MPNHSKPRLAIAGSILFLLHRFRSAFAQTAHTWEVQEIVLHAAKPYANAYKDVDAWVELKGPNFSKRVYGFWDGGILASQDRSDWARQVDVDKQFQSGRRHRLERKDRRVYRKGLD